VDLAITLKRANAMLFYDFDLYVIHPDKTLTPLAVQRAFIYGMGFGRVLRKHMEVIPKATILRYLVRPLGGMLFAILRARWLPARYYMQTLRGRLHGLFANTHTPPDPLATSGTPTLEHS
jgi:hypothetical protein